MKFFRNKKKARLDEVEKLLDHYEWVKGFNVLFKFLFESNGQDKARFIAEWQKESVILTEQKDRGIKSAVNAIQEKIASTYNVRVGSKEYKKIIVQQIEEEREFGEYLDSEGNKIELKMTTGQLMKRWMELQDETLLPTFKQTMLYTEEMINKINNSLTKQEEEIAQWILSEFFPKYILSGYDGISLDKVYGDVYNIYLSSLDGVSEALNSLKYSYVEVEGGSEDWVEGDVFDEDDEDEEDEDEDDEDDELKHEEWEEKYWLNGFGEEEDEMEEDYLEHDVLMKLIRSCERLSSSTKRTIQGSLKNVCIYKTLYKFILQLEYFKAFEQFYIDTYAVYCSKRIRIAIQQTHGGRVLFLLDELLHCEKSGYIGESKMFDINLFLEDFNTFKRKKVFPPKEISKVLEILGEVEVKFVSRGFLLVKKHIKEIMRMAPDSVLVGINSSSSPYEWVYSTISNMAGDLVESGCYHLYRGVINPTGPGEDLIKLFDHAVDELAKLGCVDEENARTQKNALRENIKSVG